MINYNRHPVKCALWMQGRSVHLIKLRTLGFLSQIFFPKFFSLFFCKKCNPTSYHKDPLFFFNQLIAGPTTTPIHAIHHILAPKFFLGVYFLSWLFFCVNEYERRKRREVLNLWWKCVNCLEILHDFFSLKIHIFSCG